MAEERGDWLADTEGNLTPPEGDGLKPPTDEFGRDDPESLERERRRREREQRRSKSRKSKRAAKAPKAVPTPEPVAAPPEPEVPIEPAEAPPPAPKPPRRSVRDRFGRRGRTPRPPGPRGTFRRRRFFALALVLVGALVAWFLIAFFQPPPFDPGNGSGEAIVTVPEGATASDVADLLTANDVVSNGTLFSWRLKLAGESDKILPGRYVLAHNMSYGTAIDRLTSSGGQVTVTIPEGEDRTQIANTVKDLGLSGDYLAASKSFKGFDPNKYGAKNPKTLEGFLFPATYQLDPGANVDQLVSEQLRAFQQNIAGVNMSYAKSKNLTVYDVLTIASMIDKEVQIPSERRLVAAVIYNRLHRGMPLGIDATTRFEFHNYTGDITESQLKSPSPYNTRINAGLTPTPIGNPGLDAIKAAAQPAKVNYLYYVLKANGNGHHCFTASGAEFNQLVAAYNAGRAPANCRS
ncbi:MAG TPA: endolytic transglycosylase MltG [Solirubrobacterales bacterium]|nr:endolytic transglycosylase MltG [Solirubrobacterales bacterium]